MLLLEQDTIKKWKVTKQPKRGKNDSKMNEVKAICDNEVYDKKSDSDNLPSLYYLFLQKKYLKVKNTQQLVLNIKHF